MIGAAKIFVQNSASPKTVAASAGRYYGWSAKFGNKDDA
jgi:hypothetical protein